MKLPLPFNKIKTLKKRREFLSNKHKSRKNKIIYEKKSKLKIRSILDELMCNLCVFVMLCIRIYLFFFYLILKLY